MDGGKRASEEENKRLKGQLLIVGDRNWIYVRKCVGYVISFSFFQVVGFTLNIQDWKTTASFPVVVYEHVLTYDKV